MKKLILLNLAAAMLLSNFSWAMESKTSGKRKRSNITELEDEEWDFERSPKKLSNEKMRELKLKSYLLAAHIENVFPLAGARVAVKNTTLINRDFEETRGMTSDELNNWLITNFAYIGEYQHFYGTMRSINSRITLEAGRSTKKAYRPLGYGRALVMEGPRAGYVDIKGIGAEDPQLDTHQNGLAPLAECLREYTMEHLVQQILEKERAAESTIGTYAVIDTGFDVRFGDSRKTNWVPAGLVLRQAHVRSQEAHAFLSEDTQLRIEKLLRKYGVTTVVYQPSLGADVINIQGDEDSRVVDFGSFFVQSTFRGKIVRCHERLKGASSIYKARYAYGDTSCNLDAEDILWDETHQDYRFCPDLQVGVTSPFFVCQFDALSKRMVDPLHTVLESLSFDFRTKTVRDNQLIDENFIGSLIGGQIRAALKL